MNDRTTTCRPSAAQSLISVILPVYNEEAILPLLSAQVTKVLGSSGTEYEIILVNVGSTDESIEVLNRFAESSKARRASAWFGSISIMRFKCVSLWTGSLCSRHHWANAHWA